MDIRRIHSPPHDATLDAPEDWSLVVTWAIVGKDVYLLLPMSKDTLKAITWDLITFGASRSQVADVLVRDPGPP